MYVFVQNNPIFLFDLLGYKEFDLNKEFGKLGLIHVKGITKCGNDGTPIFEISSWKEEDNKNNNGWGFERFNTSYEIKTDEITEKSLASGGKEYGKIIRRKIVYEILGNGLLKRSLADQILVGTGIVGIGASIVGLVSSKTSIPTAAGGGSDGLEQEELLDG